MADNSRSLAATGAAETIEQADRETMERYGITRVSTATYLVGPYRYSKLADALAEAKRRASLL